MMLLTRAAAPGDPGACCPDGPPGLSGSGQIPLSTTSRIEAWPAFEQTHRFLERT